KMDNKHAQYWIDNLQLLPHQEGGYYKEVYRSDEIITQNCLPDRYTGGRAFSTSIYFLLEKEDKSHFHRLLSDEIWHFYDGTSVTIYVIDNDGKLSIHYLGKEYEKGEKLQIVLFKGCWFAAEVNDKNSYSLIGCTVAPGFDFNDFELADKVKLSKLYPQHKDLIIKLTV
nr:cupin domain-containing protein [Ignavibacteriaceae bacterium]